MGKTHKNKPPATNTWKPKKKKLKPYMREDIPYKGKYKRGEHEVYSKGEKTKMGNTKAEHKLEVANANRSLKKGIRQKLKAEIRKELEQLYE